MYVNPVTPASCAIVDPWWAHARKASRAFLITEPELWTDRSVLTERRDQRWLRLAGQYGRVHGPYNSEASQPILARPGDHISITGALLSNLGAKAES